MEVPLAFRIGKEENLGIRANKSDSLARVNLGTAEAAKLSPIISKRKLFENQSILMIGTNAKEY